MEIGRSDGRELACALRLVRKAEIEELHLYFTFWRILTPNLYSGRQYFVVNGFLARKLGSGHSNHSSGSGSARDAEISDNETIVEAAADIEA